MRETEGGRKSGCLVGVTVPKRWVPLSIIPELLGEGKHPCVTCSFLLPSPLPYEELTCLIDEASEKNLSVSILTQVRARPASLLEGGTWRLGL